MRAVLDTSVLIGDDAPVGVEGAVSVISLVELHFGVLVTGDSDERARRVDRLAAVEAGFDALPVTADIARAWGRLAAAVVEGGGSPRRRQLDLGIAATAMVEGVPLLTAHAADFRLVSRLLEVRAP